MVSATGFREAAMTRQENRKSKRKAWQAPRVTTFEAGLAENFNVNAKDGGATPGTAQS